MKILCLVDKYYPDASANTVCCEHIMTYFKKQGHDVDFLAIKNSFKDEDYSTYNESNIIKIETYTDKFLKKHFKKYNTDKWNDLPVIIRKPITLFYKLKRKFRISTENAPLDSFNYKEILKKVSKVNDCYDIMISFSMPFALCVVANYLFKKNLSKKWFHVLLDPFVYNNCLSTKKINYRKKIACKLLKDATHVFMLDGIMGENIKQGYLPKYHQNTTEIYIPVLSESNFILGENFNKKTTMIYAGGFYKDIRNPSKMLEVLANLHNVEINLYGQGCEDIIEQKKGNFKSGELNVKGKLTHDECLKAISKSNILINLGNTITNQMPSKVFEYISFGKPIINFYFTEEDMCLKVFKKYPLVLNFNLNNYSKIDIENLKTFIEENKNKQLSFEEATKDLVEYRVESIAKKVYEVVTK
ncbi:MAG: hypothetical protein IJ310_05035 [Clostridia bacterium]|nr:hypothetical protein [Clostridia bacterium]